MTEGSAPPAGSSAAAPPEPAAGPGRVPRHPRSLRARLLGVTALMLVAAFAGYDRTIQAYRHAIAERYRFYSYGDAMAIV